MSNDTSAADTPACFENHHKYVGKCPYCHTELPPAADTGLVFPQGVSKETQAALDAIDANIRSAALNAKNIFVGAADTGLVERLTACANYVDDMKTRVKNGELTIFEEGAQELFRDATLALTAAEQREAAAREQIAELERKVLEAEDDAHMHLERVNQLAYSGQHEEELAASLSSAQETIARMTEALAPLARLELPRRPQGNAGFYSIYHDDIRRAAALTLARETQP